MSEAASRLFVISYFENLLKYNGTIFAISFNDAEILDFRMSSSSTEGFNIIDLRDDTLFADFDFETISLERVFRINSLKQGPRLLFNLPTMSLDSIKLMFRMGITYIARKQITSPELIMLVGKFIHYSSILSDQSSSMISLKSRQMYIRDNVFAVMGHMIRRACLSWCGSNGLTYLGLGDEVETADDAAMLGVRAIHFNNSIKFDSNSVGKFGTRSHVVSMLKMILSDIDVSRSETFIFHKGDGYMNDLGVSDDTFRVRPEGNYECIIYDPPWGGNTYYQSLKLELSISGPTDFIIINSKLIGNIKFKPSTDKKWKSDEINFSVYSSNNLVDIGDRPSIKGKDIAIDMNAEYYHFAGRGEIPEIVGTVSLLFRHVIHHFRHCKEVLLGYLHQFSGLKYVLIREHDVTNPNDARVISLHHTAMDNISHDKESYYEGYNERLFARDGLEDWMFDQGFRKLEGTRATGAYRSYWSVFELFDMPKFTLFTGWAHIFNYTNYSLLSIFKLPFNMSVTHRDLRGRTFIKTSAGEFDLWFVGFDINIIRRYAFNDVFIYRDVNDELEITHLDRFTRLPKEIMYSSFVYKNALTVLGNSAEVGFALWSLSNTSNPIPYDVVKQLLVNQFTFFVLFPSFTIARAIGMMIKSRKVKGRLHHYMIQNNFEDWLCDPSYFLNLDVKVMNLQTFYLLMNTNLKGGVFDFLDPNHQLMNLWFVVTNIYIPPIQSAMYTQALGVKRSAQILREVCGAGKDDFYVMRKVALKSLFPEAIIVEGGYFDGLLKIEGKFVKIAASGHILNLLCMGNHQTVCWKTYMESIRFNISNDTSSRDYYEYRYAVKHKQLVETDFSKPNVSWHSYTDYILGIFTYIMYTKFTDMRINVWTIRYLVRTLNDIRLIYPKFDFVFPHFIRERMRGKSVNVDKRWK